ncbi:MAG: zinc-ribbon domain-containing protein [Pseudomonadota bacterium]
MIITCPSCATQYRVDAATFPQEGRRAKCANCGNRWHATCEPELAQSTKQYEEAVETVAQEQQSAAQQAIAEERGAMQAETGDIGQLDEFTVPDDFAGTDEVDSTDQAFLAEPGSIVARDPAEVMRRTEQSAAIADDLEAGARFVADGDEEFDAMAAEFADGAPRPARRRRPKPSNAWRKRLKRRSARGKEPASIADRAQAIAIGAMTCGLALMVVNRESVVGAAPQMAPLFSVVGMPVNTRGIEFAAVRVDFSSENGIPVMRVSGRMDNVSNSERRLAPIRMALLDESGQEIYHWTTDAGQLALEAGSNLAFQSILTSPPAGASSVNLRFADAG